MLPNNGFRLSGPAQPVDDGRRLVAAGGVATRSAGDHSRLGDLSRVSRHGCVNATLPIFADISAVQPNEDHRGC
ncbi:hypothetical protein FSC25_19080 [Mycobacterium tuberculosis variant bovis]|nr:hypothetical protein C9J58_008285 [Mycobacterium tuberculosis variant bovis]TWW17400.1 hypothetical protein FSC25_19080 [Mycobacterium tuberculosis variant bovis]TWW33282.1 hypothetical protein FSC23_19075 [Mycobacterium tuberculosis variant bovis]